MNNPPEELLKTWSYSGQGTVKELIRLLEELEREDILSEIRAALDLAPPPSVMVTPPPDVKTKRENLPSNVL